MPSIKTCTKCGEAKHLSEFGKHRLTKDGLAYRCKQCSRKYAKKYRKTPAGIYQQIKGRNRFFGDHHFNLQQDDFVVWYQDQTKECAYCDLPESLIPFFKEKYNAWSDRFTIDCMDNARGYVISNLVLACEVCNRMKGSVLSFDEMREIGQKYIKPKWNGESANDN